MGTAVVLGILLVCCFIGVRSTVKRAAHGCCGSGKDAVKKVKPSDTDLAHYPYSYRMQVEGMTCRDCRTRVENALNALEGVYAVVDLRKKTAVIHGKQELDGEELCRAVYAAGYDVKEWEQV